MGNRNNCQDQETGGRGKWEKGKGARKNSGRSARGSRPSLLWIQKVCLYQKLQDTSVCCDLRPSPPYPTYTLFKLQQACQDEARYRRRPCLVSHLVDLLWLDLPNIPQRKCLLKLPHWMLVRWHQSCFVASKRICCMDGIPMKSSLAKQAQKFFFSQTSPQSVGGVVSIFFISEHL